tara:strand:- start:526 stop:789 length:264 start_codon:yes stop_codon:yes gene_type:complete
MSNTSFPTVSEIEALDGRLLSSLTQQEAAVVKFFCMNGRKYDVAVSLLPDVKASDFLNAGSRAESDAIMAKADCRVSVTVSHASRVE